MIKQTIRKYMIFLFFLIKQMIKSNSKVNDDNNLRTKVNDSNNLRMKGVYDPI
jgi:hypothetical protein